MLSKREGIDLVILIRYYCLGEKIVDFELNQLSVI